MKKLITHDGSFHSDDIFAAATLSLYLEKQGESFEIIRTRDQKIIKEADFVFDVGGIYDEDKNKFDDHHQKGGAGHRPAPPGESAIEYASFGLVWKKFGIDLCSNQRVVDLIDRKLVAPIDAGDNGISVFEKKSNTGPYLIQNFFSVMQPTWNEEDENIDKVFLKCVEVAKEILMREIIYHKDVVLAESLVMEIYTKTKDKRILLLDKNYPEEIFQKFPETLFVIYPRKEEYWGVRAVKKDSNHFENRKDFPVAWAGLRDLEIAKVSGVPDAIFCHRTCFLAVAKSKEGAMKLAQIAVES